jgi:hypothetical protein
MLRMQSRIVAGDTLKPPAVRLADYPASDGWVLHYRLTPRGTGSAITFSATADGDDHQVEVSAATTANWAPGAYTCAAWVAKGALRYSVPSEGGQVTVDPNPATLPPGTDTRSAAEINLAAVQAVLTNRATDGVLEHQINGRQLRLMGMDELLKLEARLKSEVNAEDVAAGRPPRFGLGRVRAIYTRIA